MRHLSAKLLVTIGIFIILLFGLSQMKCYAVDFKTTSDKLVHGTSGAYDKIYELKAVNASFPPQVKWNYTNQNFEIGTGESVEQRLGFNIGLASNPYTLYNPADSYFGSSVSSYVVGNGVGDSALKFNDGTSFASYPAVTLDSANSALGVSTDEFVVGPTIKFNDGTSHASYPAVSYDNGSFKLDQNELITGDGTDSGRKCHRFDTGVDVASMPATCYNSATGDLEATVDGVTYSSFPASGSGGGGGGATQWAVNALVGGTSNTSVSTSAISTYTQLENSTLTLQNASYPGIVSANVTCADGTSPSGTTCGGINESFGISFNVPSDYDGLIEVCADFGHFVTIASGSGLASMLLKWKVVQTAESTSSTIEELGLSVVQFYTNTYREASDPDVNDVMGTCGVFDVSASDTVTYRLMYTKNSTPAGITNNGLQVTGGAGVYFTAKPIAY